MLDTRSLTQLGWPQLQGELAKRCHGEVAREQSQTWRPLPSADAARLRCRQIEEVRDLCSRESGLRLAAVIDVEGALTHLDKGGTVTSDELYVIAESAKACDDARKFVRKFRDDAPGLWQLASSMVELTAVYEPILSAIESGGRIVDGASKTLHQLRRGLQELVRRLDRKSQQLIDGSLSDYVQDRYHTVRDDRYVVPVRAERASMVRGIIHDTSQSGQTVFVEPEGLIPLNNQRKMAACAIADEEARIIAELSAAVCAAGQELLHSAAVAVEIDIIRAAATMADDIGARPIDFADDGIKLLRAKHPLMELAEPGSCVANDIELARGHSLIISGPNAGGKTVALKTLGLVAAMANAGLPVPVARESRIPFFAKIFADIGDAQSLENSLSTFSGHMVRTLEFLQAGDAHTLVVIDEIAAATDPRQGTVLAIAVLEALLELRCTTMVTTHFGRLKELAATDPRFKNASFEFDWDTLMPRFRLNIGVPGVSGALQVARRMGLPDGVLRRAEDLLGDDEISIESLTAQLQDERATVERLKAETELALESAQTKQKAAEDALERAKAKHKRSLDNAHGEAVDSLRRARSELEELRGGVKRRAGKEAKAIAKEIDSLAAKIRQNAPRRAVPNGKPATEGTLKVGMQVEVASLGARGQVAETPVRGKVAVQIGPLRSLVAVSDLFIVADSAKPQAKSTTGAGSRTAKSSISVSMSQTDASAKAGAGDHAGMRTVDTTLDLRGERVHEALARFDRFVDDSLRAERDTIFIIHGHGTGALRDSIREHLKLSTYVAKWRAGKVSEGGDGVTVAWLDW